MHMHWLRVSILTLVAVVAAAGVTSSQRRSDVRIPPSDTRFPPPLPPIPEIRTTTSISARLDGNILQVRSEQTYENRGGVQREVEVLLPIPADAVVTDGVLLADGREYPAQVMQAQEARQIYEQIVRTRRDPALLELAGHGLIRLSAFPIPPGATRTVSFRYHQALPSNQSRTRLRFPVGALCGIDRSGPVEFTLNVDGREPLVELYSPTHDVHVERNSRSRARLTWRDGSPDPHQTLEVIAVRDAQPIGVDLRTASGHGDDDYFLLAVSPGWDLLAARTRVPESVVFVLDTSGSMQGEKFTQAREALRRFLDELQPQDRFNVIAFSDDVRPLFAGGPRLATRERRARAREWLEDLRAEGGTAIADAVEEACRPIAEANLVLFLTDGRATVGETNPEEILRRAAHMGRGQRFYAFGVGYDVDAHLLDDLARQGKGSASYVRPGEDIDDAVTTLRRRVQHPAARDVRLAINGAEVRDLFPRGHTDLFAGEPLLFAGRVRPRAGVARVELTAESPDGTPLRAAWRVDFADADARSSAVPVLWASRKAAALIDQIRREGRDPRALEELRELSERYGILNEEVALLARDDQVVAQAPPSVGVQAPAPQGVRDPAVRARVNGTASTSPGAYHLRGGAAGESRSLTDDSRVQMFAPSQDIDAAAKASALRSVRTESAARDAGGRDQVRTVGELTFRLENGVWTDTRLRGPLPPRTETIHVRAFSPAYFELAALNPRLGEWLALGERVRVLLPGVLLEVGPTGEDHLSQATIQRVRIAADKR
jgi:Ca-activated chloride channel family protein